MNEYLKRRAKSLVKLVPHRGNQTYIEPLGLFLTNVKQWSPDARSSIINLVNFDRQIQVIVTINSNLILDRASFYHFYSTLRKRKKCITVLDGFSPNFGCLKMNKFPNF